MKKLLIVAVLALGLTASGCTASELGAANTVIDVAGNVCQVIVAATDPKLAPLCTTAGAVADAIAALVKAHASAASAGVPYQPSNDEVYAYLSTHGAKYAKQ